MEQGTSDRNERIAIAAQWYAHGVPIWTLGAGTPDETTVSIIDRIDFAKLADLHATEAMWYRAWPELDRRACEHATEVTGYTWSFSSVLSDDAAAYEAIRQLEIARLRAEQAERHVLALADCLRTATATSN